jgi:hypothetical protein
MDESFPTETENPRKKKKDPSKWKRNIEKLAR